MRIRRAGEGEMGPRGQIEIKVWKAGERRKGGLGLIT